MLIFFARGERWTATAYGWSKYFIGAGDTAWSALADLVREIDASVRSWWGPMPWGPCPVRPGYQLVAAVGAR